MNNEHYRLEALKLAESWLRGGGYGADTCIEVGEKFFNWIMQDAVKSEEESKQAKEPQYKTPPNQRPVPDNNAI